MSSLTAQTNELHHKLARDHDIAMLKSPRKWGIPSEEEVKSIKIIILKLEAKLAEETFLDHPADATIKGLTLELTLNKAYTAPIRRLPFEILSEIFISCSLQSGRSTPVRISAVCHRWRETILATPLAWSRIALYIMRPQREELLLTYVTTFLQRSRRCLLLIDLRGHSYSCTRSHDRRQRGRYTREQDCCCDIMGKIAEHRDRIHWLYTDYQGGHALITMGLPNVQHLTWSLSASTLFLHWAKSPKLSYLDLGEHSVGFEVLQIPQTRLRHLSIHTDRHGVWSQLINHNGRTLKTLKLTTNFPNLGHLQQNGVIECPALERIMVVDRDDAIARFMPGTIFTLRMVAQNLEFYQYSSRRHVVRLAHDSDFNKVEQLRTDYETPLSHYRHLRVLQLFYTPALILDILDQLECDHDLCPELSVIEVRDGMSNTSSWTRNHGDAIHDRITARNINANSRIKLLIKPDRYRWEYSLPEDDDIVSLALLSTSPNHGLMTFSVGT